MNTQVNVRMPTTLLQHAEEYAELNGYANVQEVMREAIRDKVMLSPDDLRALREAKEDLAAGRTRRIA